jgi:O-antigen/teichoic acid export membrane protein
MRRYFSRISTQRVADTAFLTATSYAGAVLGFVTSAYAARVLGPDALGQAAVIMGIPALIWSFSAVKSVSVTTRYIVEGAHKAAPEQVNRVIRMGLLVDLAPALLTVLVAVAAGGLLLPSSTRAEAYGILILHVLAYPFYSLAGTGIAVLNAFERFRMLAILFASEKLLGLIATLVVLKQVSTVRAYVLTQAFVMGAYGLALAIAGSVYARRRTGVWWWRRAAPLGVDLIREIRGMLGWNYVTVSVSGVVDNVPLLVLGHVNAAGAGFWKVGASIISASSYFESAMNRVLYPKLVREYQTSPASHIRAMLMGWSLKGGASAAVAYLVLLIALAPLVRLGFGAEYLAMVPGTQLLLFASALCALVFWLNNAYYAAGRVDRWAKAYAIYAAAVVVACVTSIPAGGFVAACASVAALRVAFALSMTLSYGRQLNVGMAA